MKPSWSDAPEWAKYLAMDESGEWYWFDREPAINDNPILGNNRWDIEGIEGRCRAACVSGWRDTLEPRPLDIST